MNNATVSISLDDLDAMRAKLRELETAVDNMKKERDEALGKDHDGRIPGFIQAVQQAAAVIQYAVANLEPLSNKGWPYAALHKFGDFLATMPEANELEKESGNTFRSYAKDIAKIEQDREKGKSLI